jgi:hypothetical protein
MSFNQMMGIAVVLLTGALIICARTAAAYRKRIAGLEAEAESARKELRRLGEYYAKKEEARRNAEEKKAGLHSGDGAADFDRAVKLLHGAAGGGADAGRGS